MSLEVGQMVEGKVTKVMAFGAFVQLPDGKTGLVHISEVALEYVKDIKDHLQENQLVKVKILAVDQNKKVSLSIKKALESERSLSSPKVNPRYSDGERAKKNLPLSFEDKLLKFKQDSEEKMGDLKRNLESKRGSGYKKSSSVYY